MYDFPKQQDTRSTPWFYKVPPKAFGKADKRRAKMQVVFEYPESTINRWLKRSGTVTAY